MESRDYLTSLILGRKVVLVSEKDRADKYGGRYDGTLWLGDLNVNLNMIEKGFAKVYP